MVNDTLKLKRVRRINLRHGRRLHKGFLSSNAMHKHYVDPRNLRATLWSLRKCTNTILLVDILAEGYVEGFELKCNTQALY